MKSFRSQVEEYLDSEYEAYIADVKADYLQARAEAKEGLFKHNNEYSTAAFNPVAQPL